MSKHNKYTLNVDSTHMSALLEALYDYQSRMETEGSEEEKGIASDLVRRAELLESLCKSGQEFFKAQHAYRSFCRFGDRPSTNADNQ